MRIVGYAVALWILTSVAAAAAETRYNIRPSMGSMTVSSKPCGAETRKELDGLIDRKITIGLTDKGMTIHSKGNDPVAADFYAPGADIAVGRWLFGKKSLLVTLRPADTHSNARVIDVSIIRRLDEHECYEQWQGRVE
jgi:hypothetical protein